MAGNEPELRTELVAADGSYRLRTLKIRLEVTAGPDRGRIVEVRGASGKIGCDPTCELPLHDATVSRVHTLLKLERGMVRVTDAGSTNGTELDGVLVRDAFAKPDSTLVLGDTTVRLRMLDDDLVLPPSRRDRFGGLLGKSAVMRSLFALLERVAPSDATVLVHGETGTGKELVAEALHEESDRAQGPFVVFDCSAASPALIESELFGHVRGAFTGAVADRAGAFESADGGTLFLDEIGELPLDTQPKLLRVLERREVRRVGGATVKPVDVRIVAATHRDLEREVSEGRFREDLFYRLAVIRAVLPPLRARLEDLPLLVKRFASELSPGRSASLPQAELAALAARPWPGNVRELRNAVARALALGGADALADAPPSERAPPSLPVPAGQAGAPSPGAAPTERPLHEAAEAFERAYLVAALRESGGNITRAAEIGAVSRQCMQRALARHGLRGAQGSDPE